MVRDRAGQLAVARASQDGLRRERDRLCTELDRFAAERDRLHTELDRTQETLAAVSNSATVRLRNRLVRLPGSARWPERWPGEQPAERLAIEEGKEQER